MTQYESVPAKGEGGMAINKRDVERKLIEVAAIPEKDILFLNHMPTGVYIQEAKSLYHWSLTDKETLTGAGLSLNLLEDIPVRVEALLDAQAAWDEAKKRNAPADDWRALYTDAFALRSELIVFFGFAFRDDASLMDTLRDIKKKKLKNGIIISFLRLYNLGTQNLDLLEPLEFDTSLLEKSRQYNCTLRDAASDKVLGKSDREIAKKLRDQAYTHLKEAVDEVRTIGKFAFRKNPNRLPGYRSQHLRQAKALQKRKKKERTGTATDESTAPADSL
ncbi:MAG: hypothetical protein GY765_03260 [bacterium]|nr:hypothetical protein [bacterium]